MLGAHIWEVESHKFSTLEASPNIFGSTISIEEECQDLLEGKIGINKLNLEYHKLISNKYPLKHFVLDL